MKRIIIIGVGIIAVFVVALIVNVILFTKSTARISKGETIPNFSHQKAALMVIDIQEGTTGKLSTTHEYQNKSSSLLYTTNQAIDSCKANNIPVIYIGNEVTNPWINFINKSMKKGTQGTLLDRRLTIVSGNVFYKKKQDAFSNPELDGFLRKNEINQLYITGLDAAFCIGSTVKAALNRNYQVLLIADAIISESEDIKQQAFQEMTNAGAQKISLAEISF